MSGTVSGIKEHIGGFIDHWFWAGLPDSLKAILKLTPPFEEVHVAGDIEASLYEGMSKGYRDLHIVLPGSYTVKYSFEMPKVSARDTKQSVLIEAERILPISPEKLQLAWKARDLVGSSNKLVDIYAVRRSVITQLEGMAHKLDFNLSKLSVIDEDEQDLVEIKLNSAEVQKWRASAVSVLLLGSAAWLIAIAPSTYLDRLSTRSDDLDSEIVEVRNSTKAVTQLQRQMRSMQSLAAEIHTQKGQGLITDLLAQLATVSPDDVVVRELRIDKNRLYLSGMASKPEAWVITLAEHSAFEDVSLTSVTQGDDPITQRFELRATVKWPQDRLLP